MKWQLALISVFFSLGLLTSRVWLNEFYPAEKHPRVLAEADIVNSATINMPTLTPTPSPSPTPSLTPTVSPTPTTAPTPTVAPGIPTPTPRQGKLTPTLAISPTLIAKITTSPTPEPIISPQPTPGQPIEEFHHYSLFGYTSSYANVRLDGIKLIQGTKARANGYFEFTNFRASSLNKEFCLSSIDTENLTSLPLCIPVPQATDGRKYGPYLLPPTLAVEKGEIETNQTTTVMGKTIPGASVNIFVFSQEEKPLAFGLVRSAFAAENKPDTLKLRTNNDGSFSTSLSSATPGKKRVFSQAVFSQNKTPKSVTLTVDILSLLLTILTFLWSLLRHLFTLNTILLLQALIVLYLILRRKTLYSWYGLHQKKEHAIVLYRSQSLVKRVINYTPLT